MNQPSRNIDLSSAICTEHVHTLTIKPITSFSFLQAQVTYDFSPIYNAQGSQIKLKPTFNNDSNSTTPAFTNSLYQTQIESTQNIKVSILEPNCKNQTYQKNLIFMPKPGHNYCHVCKQTFTDYLKHIEHKVHKKNLQQSPFAKETNDLINYFGKIKNIELPKSKQVKQTDEGNDIENIQPKKKRIIEFNNNPLAVNLTKQTFQSTNCFNTTREYETKQGFNKLNKAEYITQKKIV